MKSGALTLYVKVIEDTRVCLELLNSFANNTFQVVTNSRADLIGRGEERNLPVHIINVEIKDNHEDAMLGGKAILQLAEMVSMLHKSNCSSRKARFITING